MSGSPDATERLEVGDPRRTLEGGVEIHRFAVRVPAGLRWFEGHFEGNPVLPAMVQLREAMFLVAAIWPDLAGLRRISRAKFRRPIRPADALELVLRRTVGTPRVQFEYLRGGEACSGGVLELAVAGSTVTAGQPDSGG